MEPELIIGDKIIVFKPFIGARIFNFLDNMDEYKSSTYRLMGIGNIKKKDILVFNYPYPNDQSVLEMNMMFYNVKRCVGVPGDSILYLDGYHYIIDVDNGSTKEKIMNRIIRDEENASYFSSDLKLGLKENIEAFYIPKKGDTMKINQGNYSLYKNLIEWEQKSTLQYRDSLFYLGGKVLQEYYFQNNYYFMMGDNEKNSQDSRLWGFLPDEFIVGKAWFVWQSIDLDSNKFRWDRFLKKIN